MSVYFYAEDLRWRYKLPVIGEVSLVRNCFQNLSSVFLHLPDRLRLCCYCERILCFCLVTSNSRF
jgi:hypothetical protein